MELLDLKTIVERDTISIDGKPYEVVNLDELGPYEHETLTSRHEQATELMTSKKKLTPAQERALGKALSDVVKILVPAIKPAVLAKLSIGARANIMAAWAARANARTVDAEGNAPRRRTGAASSRASKRSTAATRKRGSTSRRGS